jgi:hypothetical protein
MLITIRFPLLDLRVLHSPPIARRLPPVPWQETGGRFIHGIGAIKPRRRGPIPHWPGEATYCDADKLVRFVDFPSPALVEALGGRVVLGVDRRLYAHRSHLLSCDVALRIAESSDAMDFTKLARTVLAHAVAVYENGAASESLLTHAGPRLARRFAAATSRETGPLPVFGGGPTAVIEDTGGALLADSRMRRAQIADRDLRLYFGTASVSDRHVPLWVVRGPERLPSRQAHNATRELRVSLLRTVVEFEAIALAASAGADAHLQELALQATTLLANVAWRHPDVRPHAAAALAAFREHQPAAFEYALSQTSEADALRSTTMVSASEREDARQPPANPSDRQPVVQNFFADVRQTLITGEPWTPETGSRTSATRPSAIAHRSSPRESRRPERRRAA